MFVLKLLDKKPAHGYQITEELKKILGINIPRQIIYFVLRKMEKLGLVSADWVSVEGERPKKVYRITDKGREVMEKGIKRLRDLLNLLESI